MPFENNSYEGTSVISSLLNKTFPFEDFKFPAIKLNKVVLPEPLGPIIPVIDPFFIFNEQSETAAIILAHLDSSLAGATISELPEETRMEIVRRLATLDNISPSVIRDLDRALQAEFQNFSTVSDNKLGGVEVVAAVMSSLDRNTETDILTSMDEIDADLANKIRRLRFSFEDLINVDDTSLQLLIKEINQEELLIALKTASDELKEKLYTNIGLVMLKDNLKELGPKKPSDIKKAQQNIINVCRKLEKEDKILISGRKDNYV